MTELTLAIADEIASACLAKGRAIGCAPLTVAVLDAGGHVIVSKRSDGSGIIRNEIAYAKAWGALGMGLPSRALADRAAKAPQFFTSLAAVSGGRMIPVPGGVLIKSSEGRLLGAIGVSGDTSDRDE
ncbi:MAG TPA: heme-binding protein [Dongiaceae bacterium]